MFQASIGTSRISTLASEEMASWTACCFLAVRLERGLQAHNKTGGEDKGVWHGVSSGTVHPQPLLLSLTTGLGC